MAWLFENRSEAGVRLARELRHHRNHTAAMAVGLGGVPVAAEIARLLYLPLGIVPVVNLRGPDGQTFGAMAPGGVAVVDWGRLGKVGEETARGIVAAQQVELARIEKTFDEFAHVPVARRNIILVAEAMDTGLAMRAALRALRPQHPHRIVASAPVASERARLELRLDGCECVAVAEVGEFHTPSEWFGDFRPPTDTEAKGMLELQARYARFTVA